MGTTAIVTPTVWTSQNDVALTAGQGKTMLEKQMQLLTSTMKADSYIASGATVPGSSVDLTLAVASGAAYVNGFYVTWPNSTTVTTAASNTNYIFLQLTRDGGGLVNGAQFNVNTTGTAPDAYSLLVAKAVSSGSAVTSTVDCRLLNHGRKTPRLATFGSTGTWTCPGGISDVIVHLIGGGGGGGGGGSGGNNSTNASAGRSGRDGARTIVQVAVTPGTAYTVTVGTGGAGGAGAANGGPATAGSSGSAGSVGNASSFGGLATAAGGNAGIGGRGGDAGGNGGGESAENANQFPGAGGAGGGGGTGVNGAGGTGGTGITGYAEVWY